VAQVSDGTGCTDSITVNVTITPEAYVGSLLRNRSYDITYDTWSAAYDENAYGGGYRTATTGDNIFTDGKFKKMTWITYRGPDQGKAQVLVDGKVVKTVDLYSATPQWQYPVQIKNLSDAKHTVVIRPLNQKNAASSGKWVRVDSFKVGAKTYDDSDTKVKYKTWSGFQNFATRFGAYRISKVKGATMTFAFDGVKFDWTTAIGPKYGKAEIYVDGKLMKTVDLYAAKQKWQYNVTVDGLTYGHHEVVIKVLGTKNSLSTGSGVICDGFVIN
jgi:hypothetical protein